MNSSLVSFLLQSVRKRRLALLSMLVIAAATQAATQAVTPAAEKADAVALVAVASNMQPAMQATTPVTTTLAHPLPWLPTRCVPDEWKSTESS